MVQLAPREAQNSCTSGASTSFSEPDRIVNVGPDGPQPASVIAASSAAAAHRMTPVLATLMSGPLCRSLGQRRLQLRGQLRHPLFDLAALLAALLLHRKHARDGVDQVAI